MIVLDNDIKFIDADLAMVEDLLFDIGLGLAITNHFDPENQVLWNTHREKFLKEYGSYDEEKLRFYVI